MTAITRTVSTGPTLAQQRADNNARLQALAAAPLPNLIDPDAMSALVQQCREYGVQFPRKDTK